MEQLSWAWAYKKPTSYGMPYQGSKNKIADRLLTQLPSGRRFVDLFGGGGAMSHSAVLSGKYTTVLYNEYNPLLVDLLRRCLRGEFEALHTIPFVSRAQFKAEKEQDGFIKYVWSFGNAGRDYFTAAESEPEMKRLYNYCLHGGGTTDGRT